MAMVGATLPVALKPYLMARTSFRSKGGDLERARTNQERLDLRATPPPNGSPRMVGWTPAPSSRVLRKQCQVMTSARFARNSPTWSPERPRAPDVLPEATGMLPARWLAGAGR